MDDEGNPVRVKKVKKGDADSDMKTELVPINK